MKKEDVRALFIMMGSLVVYWIFCVVVSTQYFA